MARIPSGKASSRTFKKQIGAYLDPELVERMKAYARRQGLSLTEIVAMAVNESVSAHGMGPILQVSRERLVNRVRSPSQVQESGPDCRRGRKRIAAFFHAAEVERVRAFSKEKAIPIERMIKQGLEKLVPSTPRAAKVT